MKNPEEKSLSDGSAPANAIPLNSLLKNVAEAVSTRQKPAKKRSLQGVNEHFEPVFNAVMTTQVVFQQAVNNSPKARELAPCKAKTGEEAEFTSCK